MEIETELPARPDEEMKNLVQMQKLARMTVEPGLYRLPVSEVSTAENSEQWTVDVEHPVIGNIRFHLQKPIEEGWHDEQELVKVLHWYGIFDEDPYKLQTEHMYVRHNPDSDNVHDWELEDPEILVDREPTRRERIREKLPEWDRPHRTLVQFWVVLGLLTTLFATVSAYSGGFSTMFDVGIITLIGYTLTTIMIITFTEPPT